MYFIYYKQVQSRAKTENLLNSEDIKNSDAVKHKIKNVSLIDYKFDSGMILFKDGMKTVVGSSLQKSNDHKNIPVNRKKLDYEKSGENFNKSNQKTIKVSLLNNRKEINLKTNDLKAKITPNSTKNKNSLNFQFKVSPFSTQPMIIPDQKLNTSRKISPVKIITPRNKLSSKEKSSSKIDALLNPDSKREDNSVTKYNVFKKSSKNLVKYGSKRDVKTSSHRSKCSSSVKYKEEFNTLITASNQNILDKMKTFSIANDIVLREVNIQLKKISLNKFECKKQNNVIFAEFLNTELINKKLLKVKSRGNEKETKTIINILIDHLCIK